MEFHVDVLFKKAVNLERVVVNCSDIFGSWLQSKSSRTIVLTLR